MSTEALENENISSRQSQEETDAFATCTQEMTRELVYANDLAKNVDRSRGDTNYVNKRLRILHFNDVYNIEESKDEPKAGASRFSTALKMFQREEPCLVLFSGDAFSPSSCNFKICLLVWFKRTVSSPKNHVINRGFLP
jgi:hypothetical protein